MKVFPQRSISLWVVCPETGAVRKLRFPLLGLVAGAFIISFALGTLLGVVLDYRRLVALKDDAMASFLEAHERGRELTQANSGLQEELRTAEQDKTRYLDYQESLRRKLLQIEDIVRKTLSVDGSEKRRALDNGRFAREGGVGGAEIPCVLKPGGTVNCSGGATKSKATRGVWIPPVRANRSDILTRMEQYSTLLRSIPAGRPLGGSVSSPYGIRKGVFTRGLSFHKGMDFLFEEGRTVYVTADGVVKRAGYDRTYGKMIDVEHNFGIVTRYAHLSKILVSEGERVERGKEIGIGGSTGLSTGPHLHYEVRVHRRARNPEKFLRLAGELGGVLLQ